MQNPVQLWQPHGPGSNRAPCGELRAKGAAGAASRDGGSWGVCIWLLKGKREVRWVGARKIKKFDYKARSETLCHVRLFVTPWTIQSMEFSRPEYWGG